MSRKPVVLLIEDNDLVRDTVSENLQEEGYEVAAVGEAKDLSATLSAAEPDAILLDLVLPDADGLDLIKSIREHTDAPVIIISGKVDLVDKVVGLEMGADDYIPKPLQMKEVLARVKAQVRRYKGQKGKGETAEVSKDTALRLKFFHLILDREKFQVMTEAGEPTNLTIKEFRLIEALVMGANRVMTREQLLDQARAGNYNTTDRAIDVQILRIRKKIGDMSDPPSIIKAVRGVGYTIETKVEIMA